MNNKLICVVIVTWNNEKDIVECLESILKQDYENYKVILIDNASSDKTLELAERFSSQIEIIKREKNYYLTPSNNLGIKLAMGKYNPEYILALNSDVKVEANLLSALAHAIESDERIGAAGPKIKFYKSTNEGLLNSTALTYDGFMQAYDRGVMQEDKGQYDKQEIVFGVSGAAILFKTKMLKEIGLYWEEIKLYMDELELFIRAQKAGWKVIYEPSTTLWHKYMQSTDKNKLYRMEEEKLKTWLKIAFRHYSFKSKIAVFLKYLSSKLQ